MRHHWNQMHPELSFPNEFEDKNYHCTLEVGSTRTKQQLHGHSMTTALSETSSISGCSYNNSNSPHDEDNSFPYMSTTTSCSSDDDTPQLHPGDAVGILESYVGFEIDASSQLGDRFHVNIDKQHMSYLQLYKFCISNGTSIGFLDEFLVLLKKEMTEQKFDPLKYLSIPHSSIGDACMVIKEETGLHSSSSSQAEWSVLKLTDRQALWPVAFLESG